MPDSDTTLPAPSVSQLPAKLTGTEKQELAAFIELLYWRNGTVPSAQDLRDQIPDCNITNQQFAEYIKRPDIRKYLVEERAVPLDATARLTPKQLDWIRIITDPTDMRPMAKKLSALNLTRAEVSNWTNNKFYQQVVYEQTNRAFGNSRFAVLRSLQVEAMSGQMAAIKMYLEMTGDYSNRSEVNVTVETRGLINTVVDVLQELVSADILLAVVDRLEAATIPSLPGASPLVQLPEPPRYNPKSLPKPRVRREDSIDVESISADGW